MQTYKDLMVWQKSIELTVKLYEVTKLLPTEERFGLISQMRRCCVSIPSNIAEGYARRGKKENANFINIAYGSAVELETQVIIAKKLNFIDDSYWNRIDEILLEVLKLLYNYRKYLQQ